MGSPPKVSVFIASYNHARYLPECLDSILAQTYQDFEIVIVDDGSTDGSIDILEAYQRRFPDRVHYFWHPGHVNKGVSITSNTAIMKSQGEYLAWTGSDDVWYPDKLERQVERLDHDPRLGMVYSYADYIDEDGKALLEQAGLDVTADPNPVGRIIQSCHPPAMTVVFRRQCLDDVGLFDETLVYSDWHMAIRVFARWKVAFIAQSLAKYRMHGHNLSKGIDPKIALSRILAMYRRLEQKWADIGGALLEPRNQAIFDLQMAFHLFCDDEKEEAIKYLHLAFQHDRSLCDDVAFLNTWLDNWKRDFYTTEHCHFGLWVIAHLPQMTSPVFRNQLLQLQLQSPEAKAFFIRRGVQRGKSQSEPIDMARIFEDCPHGLAIPHSWKVDVLNEVYPALLFYSHKMDDFPKTQYYWRKTIGLDRSWLRNRGVLSIGFKAFLGNRK